MNKKATLKEISGCYMITVDVLSLVEATVVQQLNQGAIRKPGCTLVFGVLFPARRSGGGYS